MPRTAASKSLWAAVVTGIVALMVATLTDDRDLAFSLGVRPLHVAVTMQPEERACQTTFVSEQAFDAVRFQVGTFQRPGPPLDVTLRDARSGAVARTGALAPGYGNGTTQTVPVGTVPAGRRLVLCFENRGLQPVALYGRSPPGVARTGSVELEGKRVDAELTLDFLRQPRSMFSLLPSVFHRAALFRPGWVHGGIFWALLVILTVFVPVLLARALTAAERD